VEIEEHLLQEIQEDQEVEEGILEVALLVVEGQELLVRVMQEEMGSMFRGIMKLVVVAVELQLLDHLILVTQEVQEELVCHLILVLLVSFVLVGVEVEILEESLQDTEEQQEQVVVVVGQVKILVIILTLEKITLVAVVVVKMIME
jgi:hypothetical protein